MTRSAPKFLALALAGLAGLALGACTARDPARTASIGPAYASLDAMLDGRPSARSLTASSAVPARTSTPIAVLPAWIGRPLHLRERDEPDAFEQVVSLSLAPRGEARENLVLLRMPHTPRAVAGEGSEAGGLPSEAGIRAELTAIFPDTPMQVVTRPAQNAYGPYGLAIGRSPRGARCLYAWQWIDAPSIHASAIAEGPLSLRVRLCRDDVTLEALAAAMNQIKLVPRFDGTPVTGVTAARRRPMARHRTRAARAHHDARDTARAEDAHRPIATAARTTFVAQAERPQAVAATPLPAGRRYLGVVDTPAIRPDTVRGFSRDMAPGPAVMTGVPIGAAPSPQAGAISADLPPEALRGPSVRPSGRL